MSKISLLLFFYLIAPIITQDSANTTTLIWPLPQRISTNPSSQALVISPCQVRYIIESPISQYVESIIQNYLEKVFKCSKVPSKNVAMNIVVKSDRVLVPTNTSHEEYSITLRDTDRWELTAQYYPGFVRGFQTYSQLFEINNNKQFIIKGLPIIIDDAPHFSWRGLLIDTSRHFLPVQTIMRTIDALAYSKMNVLHWHIVDQDSFPMVVPQRPQLSDSGKISGTYSPKQISDIVDYATARAIRVVPQIDTPAHSQSWGRSDKYKQIALNCDGLYQGQLDPTLPLTWQVLTDVLKYTDAMFPDSFIHFGGDEVEYDCWDQRPHIKQYMKQHNISSYFDLSVDFRKRQKVLWKQSISKTKQIIYWANEDIDLPVEDDDVIQWWGVSANVDRLKGRKNQIILSNYDLTYLDKGFGEYDGYFADYYYQHWRMMYSFEPKIENVNVIGGEVCMWNEVGNKHTHQQKVVLRANILGERLWNHNIDIKEDLLNIASRLSAQAKRLRERGLKVWPVTVGVCEQKDMSLCFH